MARDPTLLPDLPPPQTPQPPPNRVRPGRSTQRTRSLGQTSIEAADGKPLPICYGLVEIDGRLGAFHANENNGFAVGSQFLCAGEIDGIESIYIESSAIDIWSNGAHGASKSIAWPTAGQGSTVVLTQYHGTTTQIVDPNLAGYIPGYADTNVYNESGLQVGLAYISFLQKGAAWAGPVRIKARVRGLKVYDPRVPQTAYSTNPALFLADFIVSPYGLGLEIDWNSVIAAADFCDEDVSGMPRWWGGVAITEPADPAQHIDRLRALAGCMVRIEGNSCWLEPNRAAASVATFGPDKMVRDSFRFGIKDQRDRPTRVEVSYTRTQSGGQPIVPWKPDVAVYEAPEVGTGQLPRRTTKVDLRDAQSHEVAYRYALQQYRLAEVDRFACSFAARDAAAATAQGDVITVQHNNLPGASMAFRVVRVTQSQAANGVSYAMTLTAYDGSIYSDDDQPDPGSPYPIDVDPNAPPYVTQISAEERITAADSGLVQSRVRIVFTPLDWPAVQYYRVVLQGPGVLEQWDELPRAADIVTISPDISAAPIVGGTKGDLFQVQIITVSTTDAISVPGTLPVRVFGKFYPPPDIPSFISISAANGVIEAVLGEVSDIGIVRYLLRYATTDVGWDDAIPVNEKPSANNRIVHSLFVDETTQTLFYYAKAIDNVGVMSVNAVRATVRMQLDIIENWRNVKYEFTLTDLSGGFADFYYGEGDIYFRPGIEGTLGDRVGTAAPGLEPARPWYDLSFTGLGLTPGIMSAAKNFVFGEDFMRLMRVQGVDRHYRYNASTAWPHLISNLYSFSLIWNSDLYGDSPTIPGTVNETNTAVARRIGWQYAGFGRPEPLDREELAEIQLPVTVTAQRTPLTQNDHVTGLDQDSFPVVITFPIRYSIVPTVVATVDTADKGIQKNVQVDAITTTGFELEWTGPTKTFTWGVSWASYGV